MAAKGAESTCKAVSSPKEGTSAPDTEPPYHILSKKQKWNLVIFVSLAGAFSPPSSNIYFPALDTISKDLGVSASLTSLTITVYMIVQGIAPSLFGALSDSGRRLTFTVSLTIYTAANLALAFTSNYAMLTALRGLQAAGSAATIRHQRRGYCRYRLPTRAWRFHGDQCWYSVSKVNRTSKGMSLTGILICR